MGQGHKINYHIRQKSFLLVFGDHMTDTIGCIRACSNGDVTIKTRLGVYHLSREEIRELLFFGRWIPLKQINGIIDAESGIDTTPSGLGVIIKNGSDSYHISRKSFAMVASGEIAFSQILMLTAG